MPNSRGRSNASVDPFASAVRRTISRWTMIAPRERVLVAVSGGADSVAMLAVLQELGQTVIAAHFNHGWRGDESKRDEDFVRDLCVRLAVPLVVGAGKGL